MRIVLFLWMSRKKPCYALGVSLFKEDKMELFAEAGIPTAEIWQIATGNGHELLGLKGDPLLSLDQGLPLVSAARPSKMFTK